MLGMTKEEIDEYFRANMHTISADIKSFGDEDGGSLQDTLYDRDMASPEDVMMQKNVEFELNNALSQLTERESEIISCYFGLNGKSPMTLEEIGDKYNLTRERVRQIKEKCIRQLKESTSPRLLKEYVG